MSGRIFEIRDPVYGFITFNEWEREIIDSPIFQRLRRIRQLALTDLTYPGAMHTRFEHSLGVMHLATRMYDKIIEDENNKKILKEKLHYNEAGFKRDRQLVRLAALLHDIGHAPFSHASEELFPFKSKNKRFKHEDYTIAIIKGPLRSFIEEHPLNRNYRISADEVAGLIAGDIGMLGPRIFWKVLIFSQLDADRCDYLLRDSIHIGVKYGLYDIERLLATISLGLQISEGEENVVLGVQEGGWHVAEALIIARYQMFTQVYYHKTRRAYDYMLKEAIKETIKQYPSPADIENFLKYDDFHLWSLMEEKNSIWFEMIKRRKHIRVVKETRETPSVEELANIEKIKQCLEENKIWFWEDSLEEAKSWYNIENGKEVQIVSLNGIAFPLSYYSKVIECLQKQFDICRIYVKFEDKERVNKILEEII